MSRRRKADKEKKQSEGMTSKSNKTYTTTVAAKKIHIRQYLLLIEPSRISTNLETALLISFVGENMEEGN